MNELILIVEDEQDLLELLEYNLQKEGYDTLGLINPKHFKKILSEESIDLILMDRNLNGIEGVDIVQGLRNDGNTTPVIFVTAKNKDDDIERGFLCGADDYIVKPFNIKELLCRVRAVLNRTKKEINNSIYYRDIALDIGTREVKIENDYIELTRLEFELLYAFITNQKRVLDRDFLLTRVWGDLENYQEKTVNVAVNRLKDKIDPTKEKKYIKTVRGIGYTLC